VSLLLHPTPLLVVSLLALLLGIVFSLFWPRTLGTGTPKRDGVLRSIAVVVGLTLLTLTISNDKKVLQANDAKIRDYQSRLVTSEASREQLTSETDALQTQNVELKSVLSRTSREKAQAAEDAKRLHDSLEEAVRTIAEVITDKGNNTTTLRIRDVVLFKVDKWDLDCESREKLSRLLGFLTYRIRGEPGVHVRVVGHTDITGNDVHNKDLSARRAKEVKEYLVRAGIPSEIIEDSGMGKRQPAGFTEPQSDSVIAAANNTSELRQRNRRVELVLYVPVPSGSSHK
jgi:outer membrane protein OmpA-like peptidoglycan-associated protein